MMQVNIGLRFFILVWISILLTSCSFEDDPANVSLPEPINDLITSNLTIGEECNTSADSQKITFAHLADLHANFAMQDRKFEKLKYFYQQVKLENPYTIFTNAGDDYEKGSVTEALSSGKAVTEAIFAMEFDIRTVGNHDFAWGTDELLEYVKDPHAKVLASNTKYIGSNENGFAAYDYVQAQVGCVKVGFFGMVSLPWNELDETYDGHFLPEVLNDFEYRDISQEIIKTYRSQVDVLVLISHLGVIEDGFLADSILGIDLILGGHSHRGVVEEVVDDTYVIQPDFYANGISQIDIDFDLVSRSITSISSKSFATSEMVKHDAELAITLDAIADNYAKERHTPIAYAELDADRTSIETISLKAVVEETATDVVLLNPNFVWIPWDTGELTQQIFYNAYYVERQKSDSPGFNSIYLTNITGENIKKMTTQQPLWLYNGPEQLDDQQVYSVSLNKGAAINIPAFFTEDVIYETSPTYFSEQWEILSDYGVKRTAQCIFIDTDNSISNCAKTEYVLFDFNSATSPLSSTEGQGEIVAFDPLISNWFLPNNHINTPTGFSIDTANEQSGNIFKFDAFNSAQGMIINHILPANGYLTEEGKLSYYSLIFDLYIPFEEHNWLALLQTNLMNTDDADLFINQDINSGIGSFLYFSGIQFDTWQRIAIVVAGSDIDGVTNLFIDGVLVGTINHEDNRWAILSSFLMFTDNNAETRNGFIDNLLLVNKPLSEQEVLLFGDAKQIMSTNVLPLGLNN